MKNINENPKQTSNNTTIIRSKFNERKSLLSVWIANESDWQLTTIHHSTPPMYDLRPENSRSIKSIRLIN